MLSKAALGSLFIFACLIHHGRARIGSGATATEMGTFIEETFTATSPTYSDKILPRQNSSDVLLIDMEFSLHAITSFDEVAGTLELIGKLTIKWHDQLVDDGWDVARHGNFSEFLILNSYLWKPSVSLFNSAKNIVPVGDLSNFLRVQRITSGTYTNYSFITWTPGVVTKTGCGVDVSNYPFDKQTCNISFTPWGYTSEEVKFEISKSIIELDKYQESSDWTLTKTNIDVQIIDGGSFLTMQVHLSRKPWYFLVNMLLPVLLLAIINALVFILPTESGERVGYSMTTFLTFAVYLTLIADDLPRASQPMSLLCYFLMCMVVISSTACIITIFTLRVYFKDDDEPVPNFIATIIGCLNCRVCKRNKDEDEISLLEEELEMDALSEKGSKRNLSSALPEKRGLDDFYPTKKGIQEQMEEEDKKKKKKKKKRTGLSSNLTEDDESDSGVENKYDVDWKLVAATLDVFSFLFVVGGSIAVTVIFLVPLAVQM